MSFRIQKSDKFADQFPNSKKSNGSTDSLLSSEDYLLFNLNSESSMGKSSSVPAKKKVGGMHIHRVSSAQEDYY